MTNETKTKHTPGPWTVGEHSGIYAQVDGIDRRLGTFVTPLRTDGTKDKAEARANAILAAAAPDLLAACEQVFDFIAGLEAFEGPNGAKVAYALEEAIAKARGES